MNFPLILNLFKDSKERWNIDFSHTSPLQDKNYYASDVKHSSALKEYGYTGKNIEKSSTVLQEAYEKLTTALSGNNKIQAIKDSHALSALVLMVNAKINCFLNEYDNVVLNTLDLTFETSDDTPDKVFSISSNSWKQYVETANAHIPLKQLENKLAAFKVGIGFGWTAIALFAVTTTALAVVISMGSSSFLGNPLGIVAIAAGAIALIALIITASTHKCAATLKQTYQAQFGAFNKLSTDDATAAETKDSTASAGTSTRVLSTNTVYEDCVNGDETSPPGARDSMMSTASNGAFQDCTT